MRAVLFAPEGTPETFIRVVEQAFDGRYLFTVVQRQFRDRPEPHLMFYMSEVDPYIVDEEADIMARGETGIRCLLTWRLKPYAVNPHVAAVERGEPSIGDWMGQMYGYPD